MALTRVSHPCDCEVTYLVEPAAGGARLSLTYRFTSRRLRRLKEKLQANAEESPAACKTAIEKEAGAPQQV